MKPAEFQDKVLEHLGEDRQFKADLLRRLTSVEEQTKKTNGQVIELKNITADLPELAKTVEKHATWIDSWTVRLTVIGGIIVVAWNFVQGWLKERILN